ncbi:MAG: type II toxin-antitoxin system HicB family antitoxin [Candidatus Hydrogenedentes bacterium]|nr:type II toxin-antitoxin system HicB family antitoxin [Candidatus Hydrogenedentota bacterium]
MDKPRFVYWQDDDMWLGYLEEYPNYMTQGETFEDLQKHVFDIYQDVSTAKIPHVRRATELPI